MDSRLLKALLTIKSFMFKFVRTITRFFHIYYYLASDKKEPIIRTWGSYPIPTIIAATLHIKTHNYKTDHRSNTIIPNISLLIITGEN